MPFKITTESDVTSNMLLSFAMPEERPAYVLNKAVPSNERTVTSRDCSSKACLQVAEDDQ